MKSLVLFSNDLRLDDNDAINSSHSNSDESTFLFVFDEKLYKKTHGSANLWWLEQSLRSLLNRLSEKNIPLNIVEGEYVKTIVQIAEKYNFGSIYLNQNLHPDFIKVEKLLNKELSKINVDFNSFNKSTLVDPSTILNKSGEPYKVYSPFYKHCKSIYVQKQVLNFPKNPFKIFNLNEAQMDIDQIFSNKNTRWSTKFESHWRPGEIDATKKLKSFFKGYLSEYKDIRNFPGTAGTSKMSPHLRFGEITTNQIINFFNFHQDHMLRKHEEHYIKELYWREFSYYILYHFPYVVNKPFNKKYEGFEWEKNYEENLNLWKKGKTGIRIVDAAMKELWETGWMHNRTRMIVASFLTKNLLIPWQEGEKWFKDTLLDADIANNVMGWQWVSGCGTDAAPYFRIFNPLLQEEKFDPDNSYTKKWLDNYNLYSEDGLNDLLVDKNLIKPIVDLKESRNKALERFSRIK